MTPRSKVIRQADILAPVNSRGQRTDNNWQQALANVVRTPGELFSLLQLDPSQLTGARAAASDFSIRVPRSFVDRMSKGDWQDPLLQQVLPQAQELDHQPGFSADPLSEAEYNPMPGLIQKYKGRVLLIVSRGCAVNCRYCFRRHFNYQNNKPSRQQWQQTLDYIRNDDSIREVILSGGDPLVANDSMLGDLVNHIAGIAHITTLRIHSRLPIVIPQRINTECLNWLTRTRLQTVLVVHTNHPNEIDDEVAAVLKRVRNSGITLLNQTVLLRGINDDAGTLGQLSHRLFQCGALPYYLHLLDKVQGSAHFQVSEQQGRQLIQSMLSQLPGYLVPRLVKEVAGASSKVPVDSLLSHPIQQG